MAVEVHVDQGNSFVELSRRIQEGDDDAAGELYLRFHRGIRFLLFRSLGPECDDVLQEVFLIVLSAIRDGRIEDTSRLAGYVRGVARNLIHEEIGRRQRARDRNIDCEEPGLNLVSSDRPDEQRERSASTELAQRVLGELNTRDREILTRFYLQDQSEEQIRADMRLTETQFRLTKCRAKARFAELGKRQLAGGRARLIAMAAGA